MDVTMQTGPVFAIWHGGPNYAHDPEAVEKFATVEDAATEAWNRLRCPHFANTFRYVKRGEVTARTPLVDEDTSYVEVFLSNPLETDGGVAEADAYLSFDPETDDYQIDD